MEEWQIVRGVEKWENIPNTKYDISNKGRIRKFCNYLGKVVHPHYIYIKPDGNNVSLQHKKYNIPKLMHEIWGYDFIKNKDGEIWRDVKDADNLYQVSNFGRIRSKDRIIKCHNGRTYYLHQRIIKTKAINSGYIVVIFHLQNGKKLHRLVHRVVAESFLPNPNKYEQVNHKDENKKNNNVDNLEWCTRKYNNNYGTCQERRIKSRLQNNCGLYGIQRSSKGNTRIKK